MRARLDAPELRPLLEVVLAWVQHVAKRNIGLDLGIDDMAEVDYTPTHPCVIRPCRRGQGNPSMAERLYRTQILLRPEQHRRLALMSREEGKSISEVTRTLIDEALVAHRSAAWAARETALIDLRALRESILGTNGMITVDLVAEARDEREKERP